MGARKDLRRFIASVREARHEVIRLGEALKWARKQQRKLREESENQ
jgi:hypothetical protein